MSRDLRRETIRNKLTFLEQMRGKGPGQTPITQSETPITRPSAQGAPLPATETPIGAVAGGEAGVDIGADVGERLSPGDVADYDPGADPMGTAGKVSRAAAGGFTGPLNLARGAYRAGRNVLTGQGGINDLTTAVSLGLVGSQVKGASEMGATPSQIMEGMTKVNPMGVAGSMLSTAVLSELGLDRSRTAQTGRNIGGMVGSFAGPLGNIAGKVIGGTAGTALADVMGSRPDEAALDYYEEQRGAGGFKGLINPIGYIGAQRDRAQYLQQLSDQDRMRNKQDIYQSQLGTYMTDDAREAWARGKGGVWMGEEGIPAEFQQQAEEGPLLPPTVAEQGVDAEGGAGAGGTVGGMIGETAGDIGTGVGAGAGEGVDIGGVGGILGYY